MSIQDLPAAAEADLPEDGNQRPAVPCAGASAPFSLLEGLQEPCLIADTQGKLLFANQAARQLLGLKGRVAGRNAASVLLDKTALGLMEECVRSQRTISGTVALTPNSDGTRRFLLQVTPIAQEGNSGAVFLRLSLTAAPSEPGDADGPGGPENASGMEKLSDPLTIIQGYLENLLDGVIRDPVVMRQCLAAMQRQTSQIQRILNGMKR